MTLLSSLSLLRKNSTYKDVKKQYLKVQIFYPKSDKNLANQRQNKTGGYDIILIMFFVNFPYQSTNLIPAVCGLPARFL